MTSNEDLMGFLLKIEDKRAKEREELEDIRKKERQEDKEEMVKLVNSCLGEKVAEAIAPFKEKTENFEKAQVEMREQVNLLMEQMKSVNEKISSDSRNGSTVPTFSEVVNGGPRQLDSRPRLQESEDGDVGLRRQEERLRSIISLSRRTVGLQKIDHHDLARMRQDQFGGAKTEEEDKLFAVQEFLLLETKIPRSTIEKMDIERIFPPAAKENPQWLYVTFKQETSVQKIFEKTRIMRKESRILTYIPKEFHSRFEAIRDFGNVIRLEEKCKTRIKMGFMDLQLHRKDGSIGKWQLVQLPAGLPTVDLGISPRKAESGSPAPGRPGQERNEKRSRFSTGSLENRTPKIARKELEESQEENSSGKGDVSREVEEDEEDPLRKAIEEANLVGEATISPVKDGVALEKQPDKGMIVSVTATPSQPNHVHHSQN